MEYKSLSFLFSKLLTLLPLLSLTLFVVTISVVGLHPLQRTMTTVAFAQIFSPPPANNNIANNNSTSITTSSASNTQQDYVTWYNKGIDLMNAGKYTEALAAFNNAIAIDPNQARIWHNKGVVLDKIGRHSEAVDSYDKAISIEPNNARHWNSKGTALFNLGRYPEALESYNKAISMDPSNPAYQQNKNIVLKQLSSQPNISTSNQGAQLNSTNSVAPAGGNMTSGNATVSAPVPNATGVFGNVTAPTAGGGNMTGTTTANAPTTQQNTAFRTYENKRLGFKIQYPSGWIATEIPDLPTIFFSLHNDSSFSLIVSHQDRNPKFTKNPIESLSSLPNFKLIGSRLITLDGKSAQMIVYTERQGYKTMQVVLVANDGTYYNLFFGSKISTYDHYFPIVKTILDSFQTLP